MIKGIHHISMKCGEQEFDRVKRFYTDVLGLSVFREWPEGVMLDTGGGAIEIFCTGPGTRTTGAIRHVALLTDDVDELAAHFEVDAQVIIFALDTTHYLVSLSDTIGDDDGTPLGDRIQGDASPDESLDEFMLKELISSLPEREKKIIVLRYFRDKTQSEVARELGVSQVQVSRIEAKILKQFKQDIED